MQKAQKNSATVLVIQQNKIIMTRFLTNILTFHNFKCMFW